MDIPVQPGRLNAEDNNQRSLRPRRDVASKLRLRSKLSSPRFQEKPRMENLRVTVPETDTGGWGEYPKALEITSIKELCKLTP